MCFLIGEMVLGRRMSPYLPTSTGPIAVDLVQTFVLVGLNKANIMIVDFVLSAAWHSRITLGRHGSIRPLEALVVFDLQGPLPWSVG
jgi:hypothetical protein